MAFTALAGLQERERCLAEGFQAHLAKPATQDAVVAALQSLLDPTRWVGPVVPERA